MSDQKTPVTQDLSKLIDKIKDVGIAMLTTSDDEHQLRSRPMGTIKPDTSGSLYFFTDKDAAKVYEVQKDRQVNLAYSNTDDSIYVSVSGSAKAYRDQDKVNELWSEPMRAWFPKGKEDENIYILEVTIEKGEYWESPGNIITQAYAYVRALATGERTKTDDVNAHAKVEVK